MGEKQMTDENLKTVEGQISAINYDKRGIAIKDRAGTVHPMYWAESFGMLNWKGDQLKERWFIKVTAERNEKDDTWWVKDQQYFKKPDDWPVQSKQEKKGGWGKPPMSPEERKDIRLMACLKAMTEIATKFGISEEEIKKGEIKSLVDVGKFVAQGAVEMEKILSGEGK
jgi:hypothetical protein